MTNWPEDWHPRPSRVKSVRGIVFQSDGQSTAASWFIRPIEKLDRRLVGIPDDPSAPPLGMHAGIHLDLEDGHEVVAESLDGTFQNYFRNSLNWTPIDEFRKRDRGGWHVTVPVAAFRGLDESAVPGAIRRLNSIDGTSFFAEDCTALIERVFGRRMFADSPLLRDLGIGVRIGDPALPLFKPDANLDPRAARLLRADAIRALPDAIADPLAPNARLWAVRGAAAIVVGGIIGAAVASLPGVTQR